MGNNKMNIREFFDKPMKRGKIEKNDNYVINTDNFIIKLFHEKNVSNYYDKKIDKRKLWMKEVVKKHKNNNKNTDYSHLPWDINGSLTEITAKRKR